jgi:pilus assembly protein CpaB
MVDVVVAAKAMKAGDIVSGNTMAVGSLPSAHVSARFDTPDNFDGLQGHVLTRSKAAGEPLLLDDVAGAYVARLSDLLKPGERAVTLEATEVSSNSGLLLPGDYIDLFLFSKPDEGGEGPAKEVQNLIPVLEQVRVLAAGAQALAAKDQKYQSLDERNAHYTTVTVAVSVEDAEKLMLARKVGDMAYVLRNSTDAARNVATRMNSDELNGGDFGRRTLGRMYQYFSSASPSGITRQPVVTGASASPPTVTVPVPNAPAGDVPVAGQTISQTQTGAATGAAGAAKPSGSSGE